MIEPAPTPSVAASPNDAALEPLTAEQSFERVAAGDMPAGESWDGVYFHPVLGHLHLVSRGQTVIGRWKRSDASRWGELTGIPNGNLLRFSWKEHVYGIVGPSESLSGTGVFVYASENRLDGKYAPNGAGVEAIVDWPCVKHRGLRPDLDAIGPEPRRAQQNDWQ